MDFSSIRIIAGSLKGRKIPTLQGQGIRPTSLRAREALFSILGSVIQGASVADLFAGSGAIGLEALSRGAQKAVFVEQNPEAGRTLEKTLAQFKVKVQSQVFIQDVALAIQNPYLVGWRPFDVVYIDPPYQFEQSLQVLTQIEEADLVANNGHVIYEHFSKRTPPSTIGQWALTRTAKYGDTGLSFYRPETPRKSAAPGENAS
ncbi:MAG: 16S rRNA (guanine(966)-N(2))-methyltransferase RsmD [Nitrospirota bacterium]|nr:16S rRNA (guanine(966)-N(2))-methyltransferase RsmD [Nitrospirota bacterium]MDH5586686.1 16S rRNA (guanine(966)-N(2))-methyltransferase RsmD [Nitrospirota bacterium]MDH5775336.1 16S rRNA (guanine(966)-N(2))-methyltransferase RsmD [Nitrospirota bacterium]